MAGMRCQKQTDLRVRNAQDCERQISRERNVCWKTLPNLNVGSPHVEVPRVTFSSSCHRVKSRKRFAEVPQSSYANTVVWRYYSEQRYSLCGRHAEYKVQRNALKESTMLSSDVCVFLCKTSYRVQCFCAKLLCWHFQFRLKLISPQWKQVQVFCDKICLQLWLFLSWINPSAVRLLFKSLIKQKM